MKCLVKPHGKTGFVVEANVDLLKYIKNPTNTPKDQLPMWRFVTLQEGAEKWAKQDNYDKINSLILEFDHEVSINQIEELASEYTYAIHTTSNHTKENHRFRIILPLDREYPEVLWRHPNVKRAMMKMFPNLDKSCFSNYQCIPAIPKDPEDYYYNINKGRKFSYLDIKSVVDQLETEQMLEEQSNKLIQATNTTINGGSRGSFSAYKKKAEQNLQDELNDIPRYKSGDRYNRLTSMTGKLISKRYPQTGERLFCDYEVRSMILGHTNDPAIASMLNKFLRR